MAEPSFHPFPLLPPELRAKIWEAACLPRTGTQRGLHYVDVDRVKPLECDDDCEDFFGNMEGYNPIIELEYEGEGYVTLRALKTNQQDMRSAYMWDVGLWMACKESRNVIKKHLDLDGWVAFRNDPDRFGLYEEDFPSAIVPHKDEKGCPMIMVTPNNDIFCINTSDLRSLPSFQMKLYAPFLSTRKFTPMAAWNMALEYDPSWNTSFPRNLGRLKNEKSARGLLANWLEGFLDDFRSAPTFWLIDKNVSWVTRPGLDLGRATVYRDCDGDYVEVHWDDTRSGTGRAKGAVAKFMT
ncbi:hypothetical protein F53441_804 [Fusarium austroafricanum]|uniref:2EXR domain-containing protein n=1 Tax=Fusarium austroafricanum TaxID=2364996 RepID=A0A8H4KTL7_9HYPO|nr:hypothetical protein F53441_804 [Fusarium austroafricanum]